MRANANPPPSAYPVRVNVPSGPDVVANRVGPSTPNTSAPATGFPAASRTTPDTARPVRVRAMVPKSRTSPADTVCCFPWASAYPSAVTCTW